MQSAAFSLLDRLPIPVWVIDEQTLAFLAVNQAAVDSYGYTIDEFLDMTVYDIRPENERDRVSSFIDSNLHNDNRHGTFQHRRKNGEVFDVEIFSRPIEFPGRHARIVTAVDVAERVRAERVLRRNETELRALIEKLATTEDRYRSLFERVPAGIYRSTRDGRLIECNRTFAQILGYDDPSELMRSSLVDVYMSVEDRENAMRMLDEARSLIAYELTLRRRDGSTAWVLMSESLIDDPVTGEPVMEGMLVDITERKAAEELARHQSYHDALTNLPNRWLFRDRLTVALSQAKRRQRSVSVLVVGIDHFKRVNDSAGYAAGDVLLKEMAARLERVLQHDATIARQSGDEFLVALHDLPEDDLAVVVSALLDAIRDGVMVDGHEFFLTGSIGAASFPADSGDAEELIRHAQSAMYRAKEEGGNAYQFYTRAAHARAHERLRTESALRRAIERNELVMHYQPQLDLRSWKVTGAEALIRWRRGDSLVYPAEFINIAEESGLILPIGDWVMREACRQAIRWNGEADLQIRVATNLSARQFADSGLVERIEKIIGETGIDPAKLDVEITETLAMQDLALAQRVLHRLQDIGVTISMDDFGTGYSSLNYLRLLPIHTVKIDRYFVADIHRKRDRSIIRAIIELAHSLDMKVLAEGVETDEQLDALVELGCDEMQGFIYSRAVDPTEFEKVVHSRPSFLARLGHA